MQWKEYYNDNQKVVEINLFLASTNTHSQGKNLLFERTLIIEYCRFRMTLPDIIGMIGMRYITGGLNGWGFIS